MGLREGYLSVRADAVAPDLDARLARLRDAARDAWPSVTIDDDALGAALARLDVPLADVTDDGAAELALALGCACGDAEALARFDARYVAAVPAMVSHMKLPPATVDEVAQEVRRKLLVAAEPGAPLPVLGYAGRGRLPGLVKVTAVRVAVSLLRKDRGEVAEDAAADVPAVRDPELAFLAEGYRAAFREAFAAGSRALPARDRNLLRLHFLDRVTLEALATMYGVHRATIVRQLADARERLAKETKAALRERLRIRPDELESIVDLVRSQLDVSADRLLRTVE